MQTNFLQRPLARSSSNGIKRIFAGAALAAAAVLSGAPAMAGETPVPLGLAATFGVLAGAAVTSGGISAIIGDLGSGPGTAVDGFPPGTVTGTIHAGDPAATEAEASLTIAYNDAAGRNTAPITVAGNIGGQTLAPGLYRSTSSLAISSGDLTLDGQGDTNAVFIFQMASTLTTTAGRQVILIGGAQASNIYWQVGSSATLGTSCVFKGTILAQISITLETGALIYGRALARSGAITMQANSVTVPAPLKRPSFGPILGAPSQPVSLLITNTPAATLTLQFSTNLVDWTFLTTLTPNATPFSFIDNTDSAAAHRFYRAFYE